MKTSSKSIIRDDFVFTTNNVEKLDPALLRSGRMDMHVHMSYCTFASAKILLRNYLGYEEGDISDDVLEELEGVVDKAEITPADVGEALIKNRRDKEGAARELLEDMKRSGEKREEWEVKGSEWEL
ncbi:hypothetical protein DY000_02059346 [Brassica cretica]|uniref:AAA+ ATPase At3g28540-like C-terminal domain-containing protein n=1 Tax=Brassica cretica TaxID=69181 RepID=A0ABQ7API3_BRACR|nr:hypothetical protein DY000_02059346 [Brassica cretica]